MIQAFADYQAGRLGTIPAAHIFGSVHSPPAALQVASGEDAGADAR